MPYHPRLLFYLIALISILAMQSCATAKKPRGCGCGMEERGSNNLFK
ncbi:MAG: hypothetical protein V4561_07805 [Bacteroidota bacterium]